MTSPGVRPSSSHIAVALPAGSTDAAGARTLMQERFALWAKWVFILSSCFYVANVISRAALAPSGLSTRELLVMEGVLLHLAASAWFGIVWRLARHKPLSFRALRTFDPTALIGGCALYALMGMYLTSMMEAAGEDRLIGLYAGVLASANTVVARAIMVPSTAVRTFLVSTLALLPLVPVSGAAGSAMVTVNVGCWAAVSVAIATLASRITFGLRRDAALVRRLGQYTLEEKIGAGGMGVVYRASHAMLRRPTAIKLLPPERAGEANLQRFEREVQMTAELSHPNTVVIYDYGRTPDGIFYYAMEYLDGINLEELVQRDGAIPPGRVIHVLRQVCRALAEAHDHGLLHRDIKPANIMLTERGGEPDVVKVLDFGLVKPVTLDTPDLTMSMSITLVGTPLYMAPEALTSQATDRRSDLYALGAVGYFLLTGSPVFEAASVAEVFALHLHAQPVPPHERTTAHVPADLEALLLKCLSKDVADRPADARTLEAELNSTSAATSWPAEDGSAWWRRFRAAGTAAQSPRRDAEEALTMTVDLGSRFRGTVRVEDV